MIVILAALLLGGAYVYKGKSSNTIGIQNPASGESTLQGAITLPETCKIVGTEGSMDPSSKEALAKGEWLVDCGNDNNKARATLGPALTQQGWSLCDSGLARASWWKEGITTNVFESAGVSYPFRVGQILGTADCSVQLNPSAREPSVTLISPNGGEIWQTGSTQKIRWTTNFSGGVVSISLVSDYYNPNTEDHRSHMLLVNNTPNTGSFDFTVPAPSSPAAPHMFAQGHKYKIEIGAYKTKSNGLLDYDNLVQGDESDDYFTIQ